MPKSESFTLNDSTSTGLVGTLDLEGGYSVVVGHINNPSTFPLAWKMQGGVGRSTQWTDMNAAATTTTGTAIVNSTVSVTFDHVRIVLTGNAWTSTMDAATTAEWWVLAR